MVPESVAACRGRRNSDAINNWRSIFILFLSVSFLFDTEVFKRLTK
jgi:hypothetical protein